MKNINSLIIDGVVVGEPHYLETNHRLEFVIDYSNVHKDRYGEDVTEHYQIEVVAYGEYGKSLLNPLKNCSKVRVVGRLRQDKWEDSDGVTHSKVYIVSEHTEFKPIEVL